MFRLRLLIKSITKQGIKFKLVFFQLIIVFISLNFAFSLINRNSEVKNNINKLVDKDKSALLRISVNSQNSNALNSVNRIYEEISNNETVDDIGSYCISETRVNQRKINTIFLNKGAVNLYNIDIHKGSNKIFTYPKSQDEIPIIISNDLSKKWDIGDIINIKLQQNNRSRNFKLKVIGIATGDAVFWSSTIGDQSSITYLKNSIIIPFDKQYFYDEIIDFRMKSSYTIVSTKETKDLNKFITYFSNISYKGTILDYIEVNEFISQIYRISKPSIVMTLIFSSLLCILSFIGFIGILISYITFRRREYGIRFALGSTSKELSRLVCGEISLSLIIANLISILIIIVVNSIMKIELKPLLIIKSIIPSFIISFTLVFITFLIYKYYILKKNIVDIIRGN
ncbi:FtsX-like permease family protein [Clostridium botulinum]|uniref:ABC transporter permease n=1 Tax=Clostridium botulinum C/D str. DC5 TaxID=1443128 RepID=A0A0A0I3L3_CLOBO|nr:FtsX-like permease family protein [Clostridium botulinum]KGM95999.1 ABC transporter permease [Clostridium botulinum C/D str. DC5]KOC54929.1 ABC transporter permease [Clostridium botulinum]KOC58336.1 ABC transporter permease [Clostridium botulinum]MCD3233672.1 FtsX-like permease family protein [Clostridium botulinum D/C]MCD3240106.1 FtsX-like permease family protein [Clostridium botulinum D/C]